MCLYKRLLILSLAATVFILTGRVFAESETLSAAAMQELTRWLARPCAERPPLTNAPFAQGPLNQADAAAALAALWQDRAAFIRTNRAPEMLAKELDLDGLKMPFDWLSFGDTNAVPAGGRSLFISMHGGGGAPKEVNDSQWANQIQLGKAYCPAEGIYVAPRAPTDAWDLWHQANVDDFFARLIEDFVVLEHVNPNRVYLLGYSAGGDGVYQLAPRTPDRWAAASMMAGHPNDASPLGLRNVPFIIQVGANDSGYNRNAIAVEWGKKLDALQLADMQGYVHFTELHAGKPHWMDMEDRKAIPWMEQFTRRPLPKKIVWYQNAVTHTRCYWLARPADEVQAGQLLEAKRDGQVITLTSSNVHAVTVLLNDALLNLDQPVVIRSGGQTLFSNLVSRTIARLATTLEERGDPNLAFSAAVTVTLPPPPVPAGVEKQVLSAAADNRAELAKALKKVPARQREGMQFLLDNMPAPDRENLSAEYLLDNVALAYKGLAAAPWAKQIPPDIFLNDILPYAVASETREAWRAQLRKLCAPLVTDCRTPGAAALALNQKLFGLVKVRYSTERAKADQSPAESMRSGLASCTGLSILLVDACRSVGVPARLVGTPLWTNLRGNHTWVEIWDGGWHFLGAAEPDAAGLDHGWFVADAARAWRDQPMHAIYATSFQKTGVVFPLVWAPEINWVNGVNVTDRYAKPAALSADKVRLLVKVLDAKGQRVTAKVTVTDADNPAKTVSGYSLGETADLNNILSFDWAAGARCNLSVEYHGRTQQASVTTSANIEQLAVIRLED